MADFIGAPKVDKIFNTDLYPDYESFKKNWNETYPNSKIDTAFKQHVDSNVTSLKEIEDFLKKTVTNKIPEWYISSVNIAKKLIKDIDDIDDINDINDNDDILNDILDCKTDQTKPDNKEVKIIQINDKLDGKLDDKPHINISEVELDLDEILSGKHYKPIKTSESVNTKEDNIDKNENIKKIEVTDSSKSTLYNMSHKQLKDLAKSHKLKTTGTKQELIALLEKVSSQ
jgi:hypothetical protein